MKKGYYLVNDSRTFLGADLKSASKAYVKLLDKMDDATLEKGNYWVDKSLGETTNGYEAWLNFDHTDEIISFLEKTS